MAERMVQAAGHIRPAAYNAAIMDFYGARGWSINVTSQDGARWIAAIKLGKVVLTTFPCHARDTGRRGVHSTE